MNGPGSPRFDPGWLAARERADADARSAELLAPLRTHLAAASGGAEPLVIRDLGCGTGSMGRWLARRLRGPQHWILADRDPDLLALARADMPGTAADGAAVTAETRAGELAELRAADLAGTSLVTASALLDLLTAGEVGALAGAITDARCPALLALSVAGRVDIAPADPLDTAVNTAFNDHQRRDRRLGPEAAASATVVFERHGACVRTRASPWRLGPDQAGLTEAWLRGWVAAACEQRPDLAPQAAPYLNRRLDACADGELDVVVHHTDLLALPPW